MKIGEGGAEKAQWELKTGIRGIKWKGFRLFDMEVKNLDERSILNSQHNKTHNITSPKFPRLKTSRKIKNKTAAKEENNLHQPP